MRTAHETEQENAEDDQQTDESHESEEESTEEHSSEGEAEEETASGAGDETDYSLYEPPSDEDSD